MTDTDIRFNPEKKRFELEVEGHTAIIESILTNENVMYLTHTEVPVALEGKGVGKKIVEGALNYIKDHDYKLAPLCPFVAAYLKRHTEWKEILANGYHIG
ncbi:GNAT family N-acetyltransferase [Flavobacterium selenitireducens]|uniref:GNAT family N-acetyltransferase n=1 Tax=Flavobacterium selenitireducens TaxID=2722704 RepID=UPI00168A4E3E|nr:GNAT family N-acetyltransferase [Flavobacterium selenitireducens]MBD3582367.1 N-acetyltransferase [Flavobacterium selenitireducens]